MNAGEATAIVLRATRRQTLSDALEWIIEDRALRGEYKRVDLLAALTVLIAECPPSTTERAETALRTYVKVAVASELDPSTALLGMDRIPEPESYRVALDTLASFCQGRSLANVDRAAVQAAQRENGNVMEALCAVAGLSYNELAGRSTERLPSAAAAAAASWQASQIAAAFDVINAVVTGTAPASVPGATAVRPIELLMATPPLGAEDPDGWKRVDVLHNDGVGYEVLLAQRVVGGAWNAHRNSTAALLPAHLLDEVEEYLAGAGFGVWRIGRDGVTKRFLAGHIGVGADIGQASLVVHRNMQPLLAVAASVATDGGTARKTGAKLEQLPALLRVPAAVVLAGPGWAERGETTSLVRAFGGRVFTEATIRELPQVSELVGPPGDIAPDQSNALSMGHEETR